MTVIIKIGRRIHRNDDRQWFARQVNNMKNVVSIQQYMWRTIEYGIKLAVIKMDKEIKKNEGNAKFNFQYTKRRFKEEESLNYNIDWIEIIIEGSEEIEKEEYEQSLKFFSKLESLPVFKQKTNGVEVDPEISAEYSGKLKGKKNKKFLQEGFEKAKNITISKALNDVGIITFIEKKEKEEEKSSDDSTENN